MDDEVDMAEDDEAEQMVEESLPQSCVETLLRRTDSADEKGCDLIVMASRGRRGMCGLLLGTETFKLLTHSKMPVLVYR